MVLRVDMEGGEQVANALRPEILEALREAEVDDGLPGSTPLEVRIAPDAENLGAYRVVYVHHGEQVDEWSCACSGDELVGRLRRTTVNVWNALNVAADEVEAADAPRPEPEQEPEPQSYAANVHNPKTARGMWISGLTIMPLGAGALMGSTALLIVDAAHDRPVSPTVLGIFGAGVVLSSVAFPLWAIGHKRLEHPRISIAPSGSGRGLALSFGGRF